MHRRKVIELIGEANAAGAGLVRACGVIGICLRTLKHWRKDFLGEGDGVDRRKGSARLVGHRLSEEERQRILLTCNQPEYAALPPGQIRSCRHCPIKSSLLVQRAASIGCCTRQGSATAAGVHGCRRNRAPCRV